VNSDGTVAVHEWIRFFENVKATRGAQQLNSFLNYFERNAHLARLEDIRDRPPTDPAIGATLSPEDEQRCCMLFEGIDGDKNGSLSIEELADVFQGGDLSGWFQKLDVNEDGEVSMEEWLGFFERILQTKGVLWCEFLIQHFERNLMYLLEPPGQAEPPITMEAFMAQEREAAQPFEVHEEMLKEAKQEQEAEQEQEEWSSEELDDEFGEEVMEPELDPAEVFDTAMAKIRSAAEMMTKSAGARAHDGTPLGTSLNLKAIFQLYDTNGDGLLSEEELHRVFEELGINMSDEAFFVIYDAFDQNRNGIDYGEFMYAFHNRRTISKSLRPQTQSTVKYGSSASLKKVSPKQKAPPRAQRAKQALNDPPPQGDPPAEYSEAQEAWGQEPEEYVEETAQQRQLRLTKEHAESTTRRQQAETEKARRLQGVQTRIESAIAERDRLLKLSTEE